MKTLRFTAALLSTLAMAAIAQTPFQTPALLIKEDGTVQRAFLVSATKSQLTYRETAVATEAANARVLDYKTIFLYEPREFTEAMDLFQARKYQEAKEKFVSVKDRFKPVYAVENSHAALAAFYELESLRKLGDLARQPDRLEPGLPGTRRCRNMELRHLESRALEPPLKPGDRAGSGNRQQAARLQGLAGRGQPARVVHPWAVPRTGRRGIQVQQDGMQRPRLAGQHGWTRVGFQHHPPVMQQGAVRQMGAMPGWQLDERFDHHQGGALLPQLGGDRRQSMAQTQTDQPNLGLARRPERSASESREFLLRGTRRRSANLLAVDQQRQAAVVFLQGEGSCAIRQTGFRKGDSGLHDSKRRGDARDLWHACPLVHPGHPQKKPRPYPAGVWWFYSLRFLVSIRTQDRGLRGESERRLEGRGRLEAHRLGGGNLHGFPGLRVAAGAGSALLDLKGAKSNDLDFLVLLHAFGDRGEHGFEGFVGGTLGGFFSESGLDGINEFCFIHGSGSLCGAGMGLASENPRISKGFFQTGPRPAAGSSAATAADHPMTGNQGFFST
jgi:hypothetical protein